MKRPRTTEPQIPRIPRIPRIWREVFAGDSFFSKLPLHSMEANRAALKGEGYDYAFDPTPCGYLVTCKASPLVTIADGFAMLGGEAIH
jgi:hypothetical protein